MNFYSEANKWRVIIEQSYNEKNLKLNIEVNEHTMFYQYLSERMQLFESVLVCSYQKRLFFNYRFDFTLEPSNFIINNLTLWKLPIAINKPIFIPLHYKAIQKNLHRYIAELKERLTEQIELWLQMEYSNFTTIENCMLQ